MIQLLPESGSDGEHSVMSLSPREKAGLVAQGLSNAEIGRRLFISPVTVEVPAFATFSTSLGPITCRGGTTSDAARSRLGHADGHWRAVTALQPEVLASAREPRSNSRLLPKRYDSSAVGQDRLERSNHSRRIELACRRPVRVSSAQLCLAIASRYGPLKSSRCRRLPRHDPR